MPEAGEPGRGLGLGARAVQTGAAIAGVISVYGGLAGRMPDQTLAMIGGGLAILLAVIGFGVMRDRNDTSIASEAFFIPAGFLLLGAFFLFGAVPGTSPEAATRSVRSQVDEVATSVGIPIPQAAPQITAATYIDARFVAATPAGNEFARSLGRAFDERARAAAPGNTSPTQIDLAATVDGSYSNLAAREFRARAAVTFRNRDSGFTCTVVFTRDGAVDGAARNMAGEILQQAVRMMDGAQQC